MFRCRHRLGFYVFPSQNCPNFSQILSVRVINVSKCLQCISLHERIEVVDSILFRQLTMDFEASLEKIFKQLELFIFPVKHGHRCREWLWQYGKCVCIVMEICSIVVICQLLKGYRIWSASFVAGVFSLRNCGWLVEWFFFCIPEDVLEERYVTSSWTPVTMSWRQTLFLNSYHHAMAMFWARLLRHLVGEDARFMMRTTLGVVLICSLVCTECAPGRLRSGSGVPLK